MRWRFWRASETPDRTAPFSAVGARQVRALRHDPRAVPEYEMLSDALLWWDDEFPPRLSMEDINALRRVLHHRTTLIERSCGGDPGWAQAWSQVERNFPDWPGLRPERSDPALADELERGRARALRECEALKRWARRYCPDADHR